MHEKLGDYRIRNVKDPGLFALNLNFNLPVVSKGSLIADKLLTLAKKSVGIRDEKKLKEIPKHSYDLIMLCKKISLDDLSSVLHSFGKIARSEMRYRKLNFTIAQITDHVDESLRELCLIDLEASEIKKI